MVSMPLQFTVKSSDLFEHADISELVVILSQIKLYPEYLMIHRNNSNSTIALSFCTHLKPFICLHCSQTSTQYLLIIEMASCMRDKWFTLSVEFVIGDL